MVRLLQERVNAAGAMIINFELTDLAYAPEIAQAMLIRQQAEAMVDARKIIVEGAVQISYVCYPRFFFTISAPLLSLKSYSCCCMS